MEGEEAGGGQEAIFQHMPCFVKVEKIGQGELVTRSGRNYKNCGHHSKCRKKSDRLDDRMLLHDTTTAYLLGST